MHTDYPVFQPPTLPLEEARLANALATHCLPHEVSCGSLRLSLAFAPFAPDFSPRCLLGITVGKELWRVALPSAQALYLHPDLATWQQNIPLPPALQQAVLEIVAAPVLEALSNVFASTVKIRYTALWEEDGTSLTPTDSDALEALPPPVCTMPFCLNLSNAEHTLVLSLRLGLPNRAAAEALLLAVQNLPAPSVQPESPLLTAPLTMAFEYGSVQLSLAEWQGLGVEDILLPESLADENTVHLRFYSAQTPLNLAALGRRTEKGITLEQYPAFFSQEELVMSQNENQNPEAAEEQQPTEKSLDATAMGTLQVTLSFELEKRVLTLNELATLAPGYTFPLAVESAAPVTLSVNGKAVGRGRIVDMNGVLGVQVTALQQ